MHANNVVHFDVHADDLARARRFYEAVFGCLVCIRDTEGSVVCAMQYEGDPHETR